MIWWLLFLAQAASGAAPVYGEPVVPDGELARQRGGFRLPNGIDVALTVQTQTAVNGAVVLHTVFRADHGSPSLAVYTPAEGKTVASAQSEATSGGVVATPQLSYNARGGIQVTPGLVALPIKVGGAAAGAAAAVPEGLQVIDPSQPVQTGNGVVTLTSEAGQNSVELAGRDFDVIHVTGNAFGSAIANSGSDRTISTETTVSLDLRNAGPDVLGSTMLRVENLVVDALASRL